MHNESESDFLNVFAKCERASKTFVGDVSSVRFYEVGGYVRDKILGIPSKDIDYSVEAESFDAMVRAVVLRCGGDPDSAESVEKIVKVRKPEFATVRAICPKLGGVDFVLARKDGYYSDGRRPDSVVAGTLFDDLARRDFTVNAIAIDEAGEYVDPFGGRADLSSMILRCVGDTEKRMSEDALRILRALRFKIVKGFFLAPELEEFISRASTAELLDKVSIERVREELLKCFAHDTIGTLYALEDYGYIRSRIFNRNLKLVPTIFEKK